MSDLESQQGDTDIWGRCLWALLSDTGVKYTYRKNHGTGWGVDEQVKIVVNGLLLCSILKEASDTHDSRCILGLAEGVSAARPLVIVFSPSVA